MANLVIWPLDADVRRVITPSTVFAICLAALLAFALWKWFHMKSYLKKIPGMFDTVPFFWIYTIHKALLANTANVPYNVSLYAGVCGILKAFQNVPLFKVVVGVQPVVAISTYKSAEKVLSSSTLLEKRLPYWMLQPWLGTGLLTSNGSKWKSRRRMLTPAFHFRILDEFLPVMNEQSFVFIQKMKSLADQDGINVIPYVSRLTLEVICETAMGAQLNCQNEEDSEYVRAVKLVGQSLFQRLPRPWIWNDFIYFCTPEGRRVKQAINHLHNFTDMVVQRRKQEFLSNKDMMEMIRASQVDESYFTSNSGRRRPFLDLLLTRHFQDSSFTEKDIREEVDTFMFEGHDTTAMGISFALYMIGLYPAVQEKLHREIDEVFGDDKARPVTLEDLKELKYLECAVKESQRLYPSVPAIGRWTLEDVEIEGYTIPKDTVCAIPIFFIHRDEKVFPKPAEFIPERFLPENSSGRSPYSFIPFSAGPRNCIGQRFAMNEEKVVLANILRHFSLKSIDPEDKLEIAVEMVLIPKNGIRMKLTPRE